MVSLMYWSNVGDRKNVQNSMVAPDSTPVMTASAGSGARTSAVGEAAGADASADPDGAADGAADGGAAEAALGAVVAAGEQAPMTSASSAVRVIARRVFMLLLFSS